MAATNLGVSIRDNLMIVGYLKDWLIAVDEHGNYFATEEKAHLYEIGTVCDADMKLVPVENLPNELYEMLKEELMEVKNLYGV